MDTCLSLLLDTLNYDKEQNVVYYASLALGSLIEHASNDVNDFIHGFFKKLIEAFRITLDKNNFQNTEIQENYQIYISSVISAALVCNRFSLSSEESTYVFKVIVQSFEEKSNIYSEGIMAICALASGNIVFLI